MVDINGVTIGNEGIESRRNNLPSFPRLSLIWEGFNDASQT